MPFGDKDDNGFPTGPGQERPIVFQKYFKRGQRTYAAQIKVSQKNRKYLVLIEGTRDPQTQEVKKHTICVFDQDLKDFFAMMQETVLYLRANRDPGGSVAGVAVPTSPAVSATAKSPAAKVAVPAKALPKPAPKAPAKTVVSKAVTAPAKPARQGYRGAPARSR